MKPVTILHIFSTFTPGGPQVRTVALMKGLGADFRHKVVALDGNTSASALVEPGVDFELVEGPRRANPLRVALETARTIDRVRPDLVVTYNWGAVDAVLGCALAGFSRVLHAEDGFGPEEAERRLPRRTWFRRVVLRWARAVVVPSQNLERIAIEEFWLPRERVAYVPNGIDTDRFSPAAGRAVVRQALDLPEEGVFIGSVGHLRPEKNYALLLDAFARLDSPAARLVLVGDGVCHQDLERQADGLGIADRVHFLGSVRDPKRFYQAIDIFVLSSDTEQMPMSLIEAMSCGLPAVCTDVGDCSVILATRGRPAIVPPRDREALTAALSALARDPALRGHLGVANRCRAMSGYSFATMLKRYRTIYLDAAALR